MSEHMFCQEVRPKCLPGKFVKTSEGISVTETGNDISRNSFPSSEAGCGFSLTSFSIKNWWLSSLLTGAETPWRRFSSRIFIILLKMSVINVSNSPPKLPSWVFSKVSTLISILSWGLLGRGRARQNVADKVRNMRSLVIMSGPSLSSWKTDLLSVLKSLRCVCRRRDHSTGGTTPKVSQKYPAQYGVISRQPKGGNSSLLSPEFHTVTVTVKTQRTQLDTFWPWWEGEKSPPSPSPPSLLSIPSVTN